MDDIYRRQDFGHPIGPRAAAEYGANAALHGDLQHVCDDDPLQRVQRAQDPRAAQHLPGHLHQPHILLHLDRHLRFTGW